MCFYYIVYFTKYNLYKNPERKLIKLVVLNIKNKYIRFIQSLNILLNKNLSNLLALKLS